MILSLDEIKRQLRFELDYTDEDDHLTLIGKAVESCTSNYLNRKLYESEIPDNEDSGLIVSENIRMAMLMLCTHFYENRSSVSDVEMPELPQSFAWLVGPYRFIPI